MIQVPKPVLQGIKVVAQFRECNMLNHRSVAARAASYGYFETSRWILSHPGTYDVGLLEGFKADPVEHSAR